MDKSKDITFSEALDYAVANKYAAQKQWSTVKSQVPILKKIIGKIRVSQIDETVYAKVEKAIRDLPKKRNKTAQNSNNTINKYFNVINVTLKLARKDLKAPCLPPVHTKLKIKRTKVHTISPETEALIYEYMSDPANFTKARKGWTSVDLVEIFIVGMETGMRMGELFGFRVEQIDGQVIVLEEDQHKTGGSIGERDIVIPEETAELIQSRIQRLNLKEGMKVFDYHVTTYGRLWKRMKTQLGIRGKLYPHMMRHTFATRLLEAGMPIKDVSELLGHTSVITTEMYTHISTDHLIRSFSRYRK